MGLLGLFLRLICNQTVDGPIPPHGTASSRAGLLRGLVMHSLAKYCKLRNGRPGSWFLDQILTS